MLDYYGFRALFPDVVPIKGILLERSSPRPKRRNKFSSASGLTTYAYDALRRVSKVTRPDTNTVLTTYTGRATQVQDEGNGALRVTRISQVDGLGRLASVCEVSGTTLALAREKLATVERSLRELQVWRRELKSTLVGWDRLLGKTPRGPRAGLLEDFVASHPDSSEPAFIACAADARKPKREKWT